jgi:nucleoside-specific outer membrane channel protein Tsx
MIRAANSIVSHLNYLLHALEFHLIRNLNSMLCLRITTITRLIQTSTIISLLGISTATRAEEVSTQEAPNNFASELIQWQDFSLTYLYGSDFDVNADEQQTVTFEYVNSMSFGDMFFFIDYIDYLDTDGDEDSYYGEFSPRFSLDKMTDMDWSLGPITDVLIATTYEFGEEDAESILYGFGIDLDIPGFDYFHLNLYYRDSQNHNSEGWQLTPCFGYTIPVGSSEIIIDGYIDYVFDAEDKGYEENLHINPQVKYNLGKLLWDETQRLYVGIEYDYWTNKYGIKDSKGFPTDQSACSFLLKYHF